MNRYFVYMLASQRNGTLYVGVSNDLLRRVWQHKQGTADGFTKRYRVNLLVWFEETASVEAAIQREKQLKKWRRQWKLELIEASNPYWRDRYADLLGGLGKDAGSPLSRG